MTQTGSPQPDLPAESSEVVARDPLAAPPKPKTRRGVRLYRAALPFGTMIGLGLLWEVLSRTEVINPLFFSSPSAVYVKGLEMITSGELFEHIAISAFELFVGFFISTLIGIPFGICLGWFATFRRALDPLVSFLYATPTIALLPLIIVLLGIGVWSKIAIVITLTIFPIAINTAAGVRNIDAELTKVARAFRATSMQVLRTVALPASVPFILAGLRLGIGRALIGVIVGEFFAASQGIGYLLARSGQTLQMDTFFVCVFAVGLSGLGLTQLLIKVERSATRWRPAANINP